MILNLDPQNYSPKAIALLKDLGEYIEGPLSRDELEEIIPKVEVLILRFSHQIDRSLIEKANSLKVVGCNVTGPDHIDGEALSERGIQLFTLKGETGFLRTITATAELTFLHILSLLRKFSSACSSVEEKQWVRNDFVGRELDGKKLGILGLGRIGEKVSHYGQAFGMEVYYYDVHKDERAKAKYLDRDELFQTVDILSIHLPLNEETEVSIGERELSLMKKGSFLINTSRGAILDEKALFKKLQAQHLGGAALDVLSKEGEEGFLEENPLIQFAKDHDNLVITPHIGGAAWESWEKTEVFIAQKISNYYLKA